MQGELEPQGSSLSPSTGQRKRCLLPTPRLIALITAALGSLPAFPSPARTSGRQSRITGFIASAWKLLPAPSVRQEVGARGSIASVPQPAPGGHACVAALPEAQHPPPLSCNSREPQGAGRLRGRSREGGVPAVGGECQVPRSRDVNRSDKYALTSIMLLSCSAKK